MSFLGKLFGQTSYRAEAPTVREPYYWRQRKGPVQTQLEKGMAEVSQRKTPLAQAATIGPTQTAGEADLGTQAATAQQQQRLGDVLFRQASGEAPSAAQMQLQQAQQANVASQLALAGSARGATSPGLLQRQLQSNIAATQQETGYQGALLRAQESQAAQQALGQVLSQQRTADIGAAQLGLGARQFDVTQQNQLALQQAELKQQVALANQTAQLENQKQRDQYRQYLISQGVAIQEADRAAAIQYEQNQAQLNLETLKINAGIEQANAANLAKITGGVIGGAASLGSAALMSDERLKTNIKSAKKELDEFMRALTAKSYAYKDKKHGDKPKYVSPMAQDFEKTNIGKTMVIESPDGKMVDYGRGLGVLFATQARIAERLDKIEKNRGES